MAEEMKRVEIGFGGGQVMSARLEAEDGAISLDLRQVVFVRVAAAPHTIGFSDT
jgi:hypothetical protein